MIIKHGKYTAKVELQENGILYGTVLDIKNAVNFQSTDSTKLMDEFKESIKDYEEFCNKQESKTKSSRLNLSEFENRCDKPSLKTWVNTVVKKAIERDETITYQQVEHVLDFLHSDDAPRGVSMMSWDQAVEKTEEWVKKLTKKAGEIVETEQDVEFVFKPSVPGMRWVKLVTENAYKREGNLMRHCIASFFNKTDSINYSLRDGQNKPHANLEVRRDQGQIVQIKGKGNGPIHPKYIRAVLEFQNFLGHPFRENDLSNLGYVALSETSWNIIEESGADVPHMTFNNKKFLYKYSNVLAVS